MGGSKVDEIGFLLAAGDSGTGTGTLYTHELTEGSRN
jgi:hypothetical protein